MSMAAPTPVIGEPRSRADLYNTKKQMISWPDHRLLDLLEIELPIILAPMADPALRRWRSPWQKPAGSARWLACC